MSFFDGVINKEHTFAAWVEKELERAVNAEPTIEKTASAILKYAGGALAIAATLEVGPAAGNFVGGILSEAQVALVAAGSLLHDFGAHPSIASVLNSVVNNLSSLLAVGHVVNPVSVKAVTAAVSNLGLLASVLTVPPVVA